MSVLRLQSTLRDQNLAGISGHVSRLVTLFHEAPYVRLRSRALRSALCKGCHVPNEPKTTMRLGADQQHVIMCYQAYSWHATHPSHCRNAIDSYLTSAKSTHTHFRSEQSHQFVDQSLGFCAFCTPCGRISSSGLIVTWSRLS